MERLRQMEGGFVERHVVHGSPQVEHIAVGTAIGVEALKDVLAQMGGEGSLGVVRLAVDRAGATALLATPTQVAKQTEVFEHLGHADVLTEEGKVHLGARARLRRRRWVDRNWRRRYRG